MVRLTKRPRRTSWPRTLRQLRLPLRLRLRLRPLRLRPLRLRLPSLWAGQPAAWAGNPWLREQPHLWSSSSCSSGQECGGMTPDTNPESPRAMPSAWMLAFGPDMPRDTSPDTSPERLRASPGGKPSERRRPNRPSSRRGPGIDSSILKSSSHTPSAPHSGR